MTEKQMNDLIDKHVNEFGEFADLDELEKANLGVHFSELMMEIVSAITNEVEIAAYQAILDKLKEKGVKVE